MQFVFEDPVANLDKHVLDHSIIARRHAQYMASLIADEGRMNSRTFEGDIVPELIRHQQLVHVSYSHKAGQKLANNVPKGLNGRDVYLIN